MADRDRDRENWDLFDWADGYDAAPPSNRSPTSMDAAESMRAKASRCRRIVLETIIAAAEGITRDGIGAALGWECNSVSPRVWELLKTGAIIETTERRPTRRGRGAFVLRVAPHWEPPAPPAAATPAPGTPPPPARPAMAEATPPTEGQNDG